jgi:hypothetical protein
MTKTQVIYQYSGILGELHMYYNVVTEERASQQLLSAAHPLIIYFE